MNRIKGIDKLGLRNKWFMAEGYAYENVYKIDFWLDELEGEKEESIDLKLMKQATGEEMWCKEIGCFVSQGDCGKLNCDTYIPRNGKNGRCCHLINGHIGTGKYYRLYADRIFALT